MNTIHHSITPPLRCWALTLILCAAASLPAAAVTAVADNLDIVCVGNESILTPVLLADLAPWIEDLEANPLDHGAAEDLAYEIEQIYRHVGRPDCKVSITPAALEGDRWKITFRIVEGRQRILDDLDFHANPFFDDERLAQRFGWNQEGFLALFGSGKVVYSEDVLEAGLVGVKLLYRLQGFLDVAVTARVSEKRRSKRIEVDVDVDVIEGPRYRLAGLEFTDPEWESLRAHCDLEAGSIYTPRTPLELAKRLERHLADQGYFRSHVEVTAALAPAPAFMQLTVSIDPGALAKIGRVEIAGDPFTRGGWIRRRLTLAPGDTFRKSAFDESRRQLLRTGLFQSVRIDYRPVMDDDEATLDVTITLEEKPRVRTALQVGFGSYELGRSGLELFHRNIFGTGVEGRMRGKVSFKGEEVEAGLRFPLPTRRDLSLFADGKYRRIEEPTFRRQEIRSSAGVLSKFHIHWRARVGFEIREEQIRDAELSAANELVADSRSALLFSSITRDTRDAILYPTRGNLGTIRVESADELWGSSLEFARATGRFTQVYSPLPRWNIVASTRLGWIRPTGAAAIPVGERFFLGGSRSFRAVTEGNLGPKIGGDPVGGEAYFLGNLEFRFPIYRALGGAVFFDAANFVQTDATLFSAGDDYGVGGGLFLSTPIGPIRVDAGYNLSPEDADDDWALHVLLGHPF